MGFMDRFQHAWNVLRDQDEKPVIDVFQGVSSTYRPDRTIYRKSNERSIVSSIITRIAIDAAAISVQHVRCDENGRYEETIDSTLNECLTMRANRDQTGRAFMQDVVASLCDEGCVAIVPIITDRDPKKGAYEVENLRVGKILQWWPDKIQVEIYNEWTGQKQNLIVDKEACAIVENPLYAVMNEPNSTLQRLIRKLNLLDKIDEQNGAGKLDIVIQLPYIVKTPQRKAQAEQRRKDIEMQLAGSKYGIAYTDGTERITQLNRAVENTLPAQIKDLKSDLFNQLGMTEEVFNGTADDATMLNYHNRTIEPILSAVVDAMKIKFLTKTARTQGQSIMFFRDPFRLVPVSQLADIADKMTRNEIMSPNEVRAVIGYKPDKNPESDELRNRNLNKSNEQQNEGSSPSVASRDESLDELRSKEDAIKKRIAELESRVSETKLSQLRRN